MKQDIRSAFAPTLRKLASWGGEAQGGNQGPREAGSGDFTLVKRIVKLRDIKNVEKHLPEILGKALARAWVDRYFSVELMRDPKGLLHSHGVHLPDSISIETETAANERQRIVVYERQANGASRRLLYLQLVMMAGK